MKKMNLNKIRNVISVYDFSVNNGGAAKGTIDLSIALSKAGVNVVYFSAVGPSDSELKKSVSNVINLGQFDILSDPKRVRAIFQGFWNQKARKEFKTLLTDFDPSDTVVHFHGWSKALSCSLIPLTVKKSFPVVFTIHDYFLICPNGGQYDFQKNRACPLTGGSLECAITHCDKRNYFHKFWRFIRFWSEKNLCKVFESVDRFIAISEFSKKVVVDKGVPCEKITVIRNLTNIAVSESADPAEKKDFLFLGRLSPEKGVFLFAEAVTRAGVPGVIIGTGELEKALKQEYPQIKFIGWLDKPSVEKELKKVRCLIFPSLWYETSGRSHLEALSLGIPVIMADKITSSEDIDDGENGFLFKNNDVEDLVKKIHLLEDNEKVRKMGQTAYEKFWRSAVSIEEYLSSHIEVYDSVLAEKVS